MVERPDDQFENDDDEERDVDDLVDDKEDEEEEEEEEFDSDEEHAKAVFKDKQGGQDAMDEKLEMRMRTEEVEKVTDENKEIKRNGKGVGSTRVNMNLALQSLADAEWD